MSGDLKKYIINMTFIQIDFSFHGFFAGWQLHLNCMASYDNCGSKKEPLGEAKRKTSQNLNLGNDSTDFGESDQHNFEFRLVKYCAVIKTKHSNMCGHDWLNVFSNSWLHDVPADHTGLDTLDSSLL